MTHGLADVVLGAQPEALQAVLGALVRGGSQHVDPAVRKTCAQASAVQESSAYCCKTVAGALAHCEEENGCEHTQRLCESTGIPGLGSMACCASWDSCLNRCCCVAQALCPIIE